MALLDRFKRYAPPDTRVPAARLRTITRLLRVGAPDHLVRLLARLRPNEVADAMRTMTARDRRHLFDIVATRDPRGAMDALVELGGSAAADLLRERDPGTIAALLDPLPTDDAVSVLKLLPPPMAQRVRGAMQQHQYVDAVLEHAPQTAGRMMNPSVFALRETTTAGEAVAALQRSAGVEMIFYVYVTDDRGHLNGVTSLRRLLMVTPDTPLAHVMTGDVVAAHVDTRQEEVARIVASYNLLALPVVDDRNKLVGVITVDDAIDVITDDTTREMQRLGGLEALDDPYMTTPLWTLIRKRGRWLVLLFFGEMLTATAMAYYEDEIAKAVVLALFVPLVISSGGNSGSQAASLIIRALAVGEVTVSDWWRVLQRELLSGLALGAVLAIVGLLRIKVWQQAFGSYGPEWIRIGLTVSCSLVGVVLWGTLAGSMLPFLMKRVGADPATSSTPFVATLVDVTGLLIYFSIASVFLRGTLL